MEGRQQHDLKVLDLKSRYRIRSLLLKLAETVCNDYYLLYSNSRLFVCFVLKIYYFFNGSADI